VTPKIIEEIQPILHREVPAPYVERVQQHVNEHVVAPTTTTRQVMNESVRSTVAPVQLVQQQQQQQQPILHSTTALPTTEHLERPAVYQQTTRPEKITEVQPIIHREIDAPQVHVIEQHTYEQQRSMGPSLITKPAIVQETIIPTIVEEIQPVIHREVPQTVIERQEQHTTEHIVQPTTTTKQVLEDRVAKQLPAQERSLPGLQQQQQQTNNTPILHTNTAAEMHESHTLPTVVQETVRPEKVTQVQPVIHREIDAPEVHVIEKHLYERVPSAGLPGIVTKQPIIEEVVHPRIIEEVQPVLHRNVPAPFLERVEQHTTEHIVQPTVSTKQVVTDNTARVLPATSFVPAGGLQQATAPAPVLPAKPTSRRF